MAPPRFGPNQTVALCGLRNGADKAGVEAFLKKLKLSAATISEPKPDKSDPGRKRMVVFINCESAADASKLASQLSMTLDKDLGLEEFKFTLQAVLKKALRNVDWSQFVQEAQEAQVVEGRITLKRKAGDLFIEVATDVRKVWVPKAAFAGSDEEWDKLKKGDTLRVEAASIKGQGVTQAMDAEWRANEAILLLTEAIKDPQERSGGKPASAAAAKAFEEAEADLNQFQAAEDKVNAILTKNLKGKGWVPMKSIGVWFTEGEEKQALSTIKTKHKQLKNFVAASALVAVNQVGGEFHCALQEDVLGSLKDADRDELQWTSIKAKQEAMVAEVATSDETAEDKEGRMFSYRLQRLLIELTPRVLVPVFEKAYAVWAGNKWTPACGPDLLLKFKRPQDATKALGKHGKEKISKGQVDKWDITVFGKLLLDDPGVLSKGPAHDAVSKLRTLRNGFVHELNTSWSVSKVEFDAKWADIASHLENLSSFVGTPELEGLLKSEIAKILQQAIDPKLEAKLAGEMQNIAKELQKVVGELKDKVGDLSGDVDVMRKKMVTMSVFERKMFEIKASPGASNIITLDNGKEYELGDKIAAGTQGAVHTAICTSDRKPVAIKLAEKSGTRSSREFENLRTIKHPNVVRYLGHGEFNNFIAIAMDLVVGQSYDEYLSSHPDGKIDWQAAAKDFRQMMEGIKAVHANKTIHRDLKPANVMRKTGGKIVIVDFGLSKSDSNGSATMAGTFTGTIAYSAPEQIKTSNVSYSADVFALAIIFYEAVSGCLPFSSRGDTGSSTSQRSTIAALDNPYAVSKYTTAVVEGTAMPLEEVPQEVRAFIDRCFTKAPEKRPADAGVMLAEWDEAAAAAETAILQKAQGTDADVFWSTKFDDAPSIDSELFSAAMLAEFKMDSAASLRVEKAMDEDANGEISRAEWAAFIKEEKVADVVARFAAPSPEEEAKGAEPAGVFLEKYKDYGPISFTSNGSFLGGFGGKKQRTGCLKLGGSFIVAYRFDGQRKVEEYRFSMLSNVMKDKDAKVINILEGGKPRQFTFSDAAVHALTQQTPNPKS